MITIINGTSMPLTDIGLAAGICWKSDITNSEKNIKRALDCIESGHGRVMEYPDITLYIEGYSARCIRELYTHIIGTTRLQESTRYVDESGFSWYNPFIDEEHKKIYEDCMNQIQDSYQKLLEMGASKEDAANVLPLGMHTSIVLKINVRALEHLANERLCSRAYKEIRSLVREIKKTLSGYSEEWKLLVDKIMVPKCSKNLFCSESKTCGKKITREKLTFCMNNAS